MTDPSPSTADVRPRLALGLLIALTGAKLAVHLALVGRYGYFRDELYFLDCGRHLDFGYVDHAPLIGLLAWLLLKLGAALPLLRAVPALAGAGLVAMSMAFTRTLGGGRFAQGLAGLAVLIMPITLGVDSIFSMNAFEPLIWLGCAWVLVRLVSTGDSRLWLLYGVLAGVGLENKHSMLFFGLATAVAVVATPLRRELARPWVYLGGGVALLLFLPNLIWQVSHGFPTLEDLRNVRETGKNVELPPLQFLGQQALMVHPMLLPVWLAGLWHFLFGRGRELRVIGVLYLVLLGTMMVLHGKDYYLAGAYPMLLAGGAACVEGWLARLQRARPWLEATTVGLITLAGAITAPLMLPLLSPERYVAYQQLLGIEPQRTEVGHVGTLPQLFGDQFGWPELVADVARVYDALPAEERAVACIFAGNYGEAGAVNLFGPRYGLPTAISGHQTHFFWGPRGCTGQVMIVLQDTREALEREFESVEEAGAHHHPLGMAEENGPIFVGRRIKIPVDEIWPRVKHWN